MTETLAFYSAMSTCLALYEDCVPATSTRSAGSTVSNAVSHYIKSTHYKTNRSPTHAYNWYWKSEVNPQPHSHQCHTVVTSAITPANDDRQLWYICARNGANHLGAILRDATLLGLGAYHVTCHINEEEQRYLALRAQLYEMCRLQRRLREQDAVIGHNANGVAVNVSKPLRYSSVTCTCKVT